MVMKSLDLALRFQLLVANLFVAEGFEVEKGPWQHDGPHPDLFIKKPTGPGAIVEIKLFRSIHVSFSTLQKAVAALEHQRESFKVMRSILVIGGKVAVSSQEILQEQGPATIVYDIDALAFLVSKHPEFDSEFSGIIRETFVFSQALNIEPKSVNPLEEVSFPSLTRVKSLAAVPAFQGRRLCRELKDIPAGPADAKTFEKKMEQALRYIHENDMASWAAQKATDGKISIYDLIARISSEHDFWKMLLTQFNSRYIIFEFKNYAEAIKQGQIYTTEKYLFVTALRAVAIIISRKGADKNARAAARGALRESGKLIINLDINDICKMLHLRDAGDDHNTVLVERVDDVLMSLER